MNLMDEVKNFGFINGTLKFGKYKYSIRLITNLEYAKYLELLKAEDKAIEALKYITNRCIFRTRKILFWEKKIFDFDINKYPAVMNDRFIRDLFLILLDKNFFQKLLDEGELIEK